MKNLIVIIFVLIATAIEAQSSLNMNLVYQWQDASLTPSSAHDNTYNEDIWLYIEYRDVKTGQQFLEKNRPVIANLDDF